MFSVPEEGYRSAAGSPLSVFAEMSSVARQMTESSPPGAYCGYPAYGYPAYGDPGYAQRGCPLLRQPCYEESHTIYFSYVCTASTVVDEYL